MYICIETFRSLSGKGYTKGMEISNWRYFWLSKLDKKRFAKPRDFLARASDEDYRSECQARDGEEISSLYVEKFPSNPVMDRWGDPHNWHPHENFDDRRFPEEGNAPQVIDFGSEDDSPDIDLSGASMFSLSQDTDVPPADPDDIGYPPSWDNTNDSTSNQDISDSSSYSSSDDGPSYDDSSSDSTDYSSSSSD